MAIPKHIMQLHCRRSTNSIMTAEALEAVEAVGGKAGSSRFRAVEK
jgi:hypothetical protein